MTPTRILLVDDERPLLELLGGYLRREGYEISFASHGAEAVEVARTVDPDLIVLDLMLPGLDGIEVCRQVRQFSDAYIVMLTARAEETDRIIGLGVGADDYITKPFSPREVVARVKARLRRPHRGASPEPVSAAPQRSGDLTIDRERFEVSRDGEPIPLTAREFQLLAALAEHPGRVFTRQQLLDRVWGSDAYDDHVVEVHVGNLRRKIEEDPSRPAYLLTVRGVGYRWAAGPR